MTPAGLPDGIAGLRRALARGEVGLADALARQRDALARQDLHCVARMIEPAAAPDARLPLAGVGLAHKDIFHMGGRAPGCGAAAEPARSRQAAGAVRRLESAGAATLAALVMAEHACGATGENPRQPLPRNPIDPAAAVGGSSSGSAVAVAAGLCYGSLGTDTAGSVRIPAATCGLVGLKPTPGRLSRSGVAPLAPTLDTPGLLARSAADAAALFAALAGSARHAPRVPAAGEWRVAVCWSQPAAAGAPADAVLAQLDAFARRACVRPAPTALPLLAEWQRLAHVVLHAEAAAVHARALRGEAEPLGALAAGVALPGAVLPAAWYAQALARRRAHARAFAAALDGCDLLLTPLLPQPAPDWSEVDTRSPGFQPRRLLELFSWTPFVNYLGLPAVAFPVAADPRGRPISVQAVARPGADELLLAFAAAFAASPTFH